MDFFCPECKQKHSPDIANLTIPLPGPLQRIEAEERVRRAEIFADAAVLDAKQHFIRAILPIPVRGEEASLDVSVWVAVPAKLYQSYAAMEDDSSRAEGEGHLANSLRLFGLEEGETVTVLLSSTSLPRLLAPSKESENDGRVALLLGEGLEEGDVAELLHVLSLPDRREGEGESETGATERTRSERYRQIERRFVLGRFLARLGRAAGASLPLPELGGETPTFFGVLLEAPNRGESSTTLLPPVYLGAEDVEVLLGQATAIRAERGMERALGKSRGEAEGPAPESLVVWDLEGEEVAFERTWSRDGTVEDKGTLPSAVLLARVLAGRAGYFSLAQLPDGEITPVVGALLEADSKWLEPAVDALELLSVAGSEMAGVFGAFEDGSLIWFAKGEGALQLSELSRSVYVSWLRRGEAASVLDTNDRSARERLALRMRQCDNLLGSVFPILHRASESGVLLEGEMERLETVGEELHRDNVAAGATEDYGEIVYSFVEAQEED